MVKRSKPRPDQQKKSQEPSAQSEYGSLGYQVFSTNLQPKLTELRKKLVTLYDTVACIDGFDEKITDDDGIIRLYQSQHRDAWVSLFNQIERIPEVYAFANEPEILDIVRELGVRQPAIGVYTPNIRCDMPKDDKWLFKPHQDISFNGGSLNSVNLWIPLQDITENYGPLNIDPGTHQNAIYPFDDDTGMIVDYEPTAPVVITLKCGEILAFSQFIVHWSGSNQSDKVRFTMILRYSDLESPEYAARRFYLPKPQSYKMADLDPAVTFSLNK